LRSGNSQKETFPASDGITSSLHHLITILFTVTLSTLSNDAISVSQVRSSYTDTGPEHELMAN
jgi:hypothetical protein